jgi:hypothetical protein
VKRLAKQFIVREHQFQLNTENRRMVCQECDGIMNECAPSCPGLSATRRVELAGQLTDNLRSLATHA